MDNLKLRIDYYPFKFSSIFGRCVQCRKLKFKIPYRYSIKKKLCKKCFNKLKIHFRCGTIVSSYAFRHDSYIIDTKENKWFDYIK